MTPAGQTTPVPAGRKPVRLRDFFSNVLRYTAWLLRMPASQSKGALFSAYLKLCIKYLLVVRLLGRKPVSEKLLGFDVAFFDYHSLIVLFEELFITEEYRFRSETPSPVVIDCGSNIGMSVLYFKKVYPGARILAFEPDPRSFEALKRNVERNRLADVHVFNCAVSDREGPLEFFSDGDHPGDTGASAKRNVAWKSRQTVQGVVLSTYLAGAVDFLKVDIEGSEDDVFAEVGRSGKLRLVRESIIEYHHHVVPGTDRLSSFLGVLEANGFGYQISGFCRFQKGKPQAMMIYAYRKENGWQMMTSEAAS
jgi:FkbM family methyltransferase